MNPTRHKLRKRVQRNLVLFGLLAFVWLMCSGNAAGESLTERQQAFPDWTSKPTVQASDGDLVYPKWMVGTWRMSSTLISMVAPLAPEIVTPGFEGNRQFLHKAIPALVRFVPRVVSKGGFLGRSLPAYIEDADEKDIEIISDRAFNGLSLARAYLGDDWVKAVKVDPNDPNRQITFLKDDRQLISTVTGRQVEMPNLGTFATTEIFQQFFRNPGRSFSVSDDTPTVYLNEVENTTVYRKRGDANFPIVADQITAIYLSPQDPDYFKAKGQPVALYRYQLSFSPVQASAAFDVDS
ncbi:hypothetical protein S7335_5016 [Synechococcus sp. PCC 7335]|uniref:DUF6816 family protein n=1 Tax=Synechococcus sp. (strain ATCC 29403 / PCC 7335) TaxID=91464 RepID=UPI00017EDC79|nr:hypothetical protein [Synechococcus sp. PCC 7335]EDX87308.1 hypothetical protein S7335_5016 [Synechococcus sp. PCC 7335]